FMTQAAYSENDIRAMTQAFQTAHPDVQVNLEFVPYEALHDKIVAARGAGGNGYDVVLFDAIWPAEFSKFDLLQDVSSRISADEKEKIFPGALNTVVFKGKTLGMPW
ncbi:extracellular solute-binding protein, partial [Escherichia coli]|uniref:extracellular solute-binding protein n=2 Tax=Enterobacterales TaxID=91347 RepID=UPI002446E92B